MKKAILFDAGGVLLDETEYEKVTAEILISILQKLYQIIQKNIIGRILKNQ